MKYKIVWLDNKDQRIVTEVIGVINVIETDACIAFLNEKGKQIFALNKGRLIYYNMN